jgi:hypothetical protein
VVKESFETIAGVAIMGATDESLMATAGLAFTWSKGESVVTVVGVAIPGAANVSWLATIGLVIVGSADESWMTVDGSAITGVANESLFANAGPAMAMPSIKAIRECFQIVFMLTVLV